MHVVLLTNQMTGCCINCLFSSYHCASLDKQSVYVHMYRFLFFVVYKILNIFLYRLE